MSLESISSVNAINEISTKSREYSKIPVDKKLFQALEEECSDIKPLDIIDIDKKNIRKSKAGMRLMKNAVQNQQNIKNIASTNKVSISLEQQIINSDLALIEARIRESFSRFDAANSSACINSIKQAQARYLIQRGTPEALATLDRFNLRPWI